MNKSESRSIDWSSTVFSILVVVFAWLLVIRAPWDPDMGWHIRNGGDVLRFGAPIGDLYSHTMFGYPWISHEWLTDALMYLVNRYWGLVTMSAIFGVITVSAYLVAARVARARWESAAVTIVIAALVAMPIVGVRPQMLTLLGLATTLWLLFRWKDNPQNHLIYWLPLLMLVWVNLHGGFAAGLLLMAVFGAIELIKFLLRRYSRLSMAGRGLDLREIFELVVVGLLSFGATFVNPYTWRIYDELFRTIFNDLVRSGIAEWMPVTLRSAESHNLVIYAIFVLLLLVFSAKKVDSTKIWLGVVFLLFSLTSWRNMPLFSIVTLPLVTEMIEALAPRGIYYQLRWGWVTLVLLGFIGYVGYDRFCTITALSTNEALLGAGGVNEYPYGAVQFLKERHLSGRMFNEYNWGGYLVWKLPEKKVFIDGRMAIWKTREQDIFKDYIALAAGGTETATMLEGYRVDMALIYTERALSRYLLARPGEWELVYRDKLTSIFRRVTTAPSTSLDLVASPDSQ